MKRIEHNEEKWEFPFVEYCCEEDEKKLPLIIQLHGAGERGKGGAELDLVDVHGFSEYLKTAECKCRFVMPQCPKDTFWAARVESLIKFIKHLIKDFDADENRVYLTGLSMGGFGTWFCAMTAPELFAAIAPCCGGGMGWNAEVLKMPVWAFHGSCDEVVAPFYSDDMVKSLKALGANVKYTRIDGVGHDVWDRAYNKELLEWLLSQSK